MWIKQIPLTNVTEFEVRMRDRENEPNEVSKIFIVSLRLFGCERKETNKLKFSGRHSEKRPAKLTNHTARTN